MARISYDDQTAAAYKAVREIPRDGLGAWREAVRRHLRPLQGMTVTDIGAGTGAAAWRQGGRRPRENTVRSSFQDFKSRPRNRMIQQATARARRLYVRGRRLTITQSDNGRRD